jgi:non-ribosomal peptide synthetase component E (peptide arylation enzyme)
LLVTHADITDAACIAIPDRVMGEKVCAFVIARPGTEPTLDAVRTHLLERGLARFKLPERLEVRGTLPRTASGKVRKAPLRDELHDEAQSG